MRIICEQPIYAVSFLNRNFELVDDNYGFLIFQSLLQVKGIKYNETSGLNCFGTNMRIEYCYWSWVGSIRAA